MLTKANCVDFWCTTILLCCKEDQTCTLGQWVSTICSYDMIILSFDIIFSKASTAQDLDHVDVLRHAASIETDKLILSLDVACDRRS